jgi:hypothetical protein
MTTPITEFIGIYDADSTLWGEVSYWIGARLGRTHCSLCDITHGVFMKKKQWQQCSGELSVPFTTYHRNDAPQEVLALASGSFPVVLARRKDSLSVVLTNDQLERFGGSPHRFMETLQEQLQKEQSN